MATGGDCAEGFGGEWTCYNANIENVSFDGETVTVDLNIYREGDSLIVDSGEIRLFVDDTHQESIGGVAPTSGPWGSDYTLSGQASQGDSIQIDFVTSQWSELDTISVHDTVPSAPADIGVTGISVSPTDPEAEHEATVSVTAKNTGGESGQQTFNVDVDGNFLSQLGFNLGAGQSDTQSVTWTPITPGSRTITAGGESTTVSVQDSAAASITTTDVSVSGTPTVGDQTAVQVTASNAGDLTGSESFDVWDGGDHIGVVDFNLGPGESDTQSVNWTPSTAETTTLAAGNSSTQVTVQSPDESDITVDSVNVPTNPTVGISETVEVTAVNNGDAEGSADFTVAAGGTSIGTLSYTIPPGGFDAGGFETKSIEWTPTTAGETTVTAGSRSTTVTVQEAPSEADITVSGITFDPSDPTAGEQVSINVEATNTGGQTGTREVQVNVGGQTRELSFSLAGGQSDTKAVQWTFGSAGDYDVTAGTATATVTVAAESDGDGDDGGGDGDDDPQDGLTDRQRLAVAAGAAVAGGLALRAQQEDT